MSKFFQSNKHLLVTIIIAIIFTAIGFFAGSKISQNKGRRNMMMGNPPGQMEFGGNNLKNGSGNRSNMGGNVMGEISSNDSNSITVKMANGSSKIVLFTEKTSINKATQAVFSDLKVGERVMIFGSTNTDGSVTAQNVQLNPIQNQPKN